MHFGIEPDYLNQVLSQWLMEVRVVRMRRVPASTRMKRKRYYRKKRSSLKRKQKVNRRKASSKRKAKRRRVLRKRMRLKTGSRKRIRLASAQELSGGLMESTQAVNAVKLIQAFRTAKALSEELMKIEDRLKTQPKEKLINEWSLPSIEVQKSTLFESIDELLGEPQEKGPKYDSPQAILSDCNYMIESLETYSVDLEEAQSILVMMTEWLDRASESLAMEAKENPRIYFDKDLTKPEAKKVIDALESELNIESATVADRSSIELVGGRPKSDEIRQAIETARVKNKIQHISDVQGEAMQEAAKTSVKVYDNGGKTVDRYTVVVDQGDSKDFYGLARDPSQFNQFLGQTGDGFTEGSHLGELVAVDSLPPAAQKAVQDRVSPKAEVSEAKVHFYPQVLDGYLVAALWSSSDSDGNPLDDKYDVEDISDESMDRSIKDVAKFLDNAAMLGDISQLDDAQIGHDFWLTRNRHGAGFWDGDYEKELGEKLTELSHKFGEVDLIVGDDGKLHIEGGKMVEATVTEEKLQLWKRASNYSGEDLTDYYVGPSKHRDSDALEQSNFDSTLKMLGGEDGEKVRADRFGHWGVGWLEQIFVHKDAADKVEILKKVLAGLEDYPVVDDDDFYERERQELDDTFEGNKDQFVSALSKAMGVDSSDLKPDEEKALEEIAKAVLDWSNGYYGLRDAWVDPASMKKNMGDHDWKNLEFNIKHPILAKLKAAIQGK